LRRASRAATASGASDTETGGAPERGAPPHPGTRAALLVAPVRLALGAAGLALAISLGLTGATALAAAAAGAVLTVFTLTAPGGRRKPEPLRPPGYSGASTDNPWWRVLAVAMFPSTYGVALLTGIALAFNNVLAAFLSGVMLGMGAVALVYGLRFRA
jgi:hypothetical protein